MYSVPVQVCQIYFLSPMSSMFLRQDKSRESCTVLYRLHYTPLQRLKVTLDTTQWSMLVLTCIHKALNDWFQHNNLGKVYRKLVKYSPFSILLYDKKYIQYPPLMVEDLVLSRKKGKTNLNNIKKRFGLLYFAIKLSIFSHLEYRMIFRQTFKVS